MARVLAIFGAVLGLAAALLLGAELRAARPVFGEALVPGDLRDEVVARATHLGTLRNTIAR